MKEYIIQANARPRGSAGPFQLEIKVVEARDAVTAENLFRAQWETFGGFSIQAAVRHYE